MGRKVKGGVEVKEEGQKMEEGDNDVDTPFPNKPFPSTNRQGLEQELIQLLASCKLEAAAMIASGWLFGFKERARLTYGSTGLTLFTPQLKKRLIGEGVRCLFEHHQNYPP